MSRHGIALAWSALLLNLGAGAAWADGAKALKVVKVLLPDRHNLQYMPFWVAHGAGYFAAEGLDIQLVIPPDKVSTIRIFQDHQAPVAVLPPPMYLPLLAQKEPMVLVANLLSNDPVNVVISKQLLTARKLSTRMPLRDKLKGLKGLRVGVAPGPPTRLRALFRSVGLDADSWVHIVTIHGAQQNQAFLEHRVDVLYCHTPFLERALVDQGAMILIDQSGGEVRALAQRQIHALVVSRNYLLHEPEAVRGLWRAIQRALVLIHSNQAATVRALAREMPERPRKQLETIVRVYAPAVPKTPLLSPDGFGPALLLYPASMTAPDLAGLNLSDYVYRPA